MNIEASEGQSWPAKQSRWLTLLRGIMNFGIKLNQNNPAGDHHFGPSTRRAKLPIWSHLAQIFYVYFTLKMLANFFLQHEYNRLTWGLQDQRHQGIPSETIQMKRANLELTVGRLRWLGNAYYEFGFAAEPTCLFALYMVYIGYLKPLIHTAKRGPATFRLARMFLDPASERELFIRADIERQVRAWIESSENHMHEQVAAAAAAQDRSRSQGRRGRRIHRRQRPTIGPLPPMTHVSETVRRSDFELAHARNVSELRALEASGQLMPLNRTDDWAEFRLAEMYAKANVFIVIGFFMAVVFLLILPRANLTTARLHNEPRDMLFQAELLAYCLWGIFSVNFHLLLVLLSAVDQIKFVGQLRQLVAGLTRDATLIVVAQNMQPRELKQQLEATSDHEEPQLNKRLMRLVIQYKLLKQQIAGTRAIVGSMSAGIIIMMLLAPALVRLQVAHLSAGVRYLYLTCCLCVILAVDVIILPSCWLCARCIELFRSMSFLLAHINAASSSTTTTEHDEQVVACDRIYDEHTVAQLRREQRSPELTIRHFAIDAHFLRLTYANFMGVHFYCAILLAPMLMRDTSSIADGNLLYLF